MLTGIDRLAKTTGLTLRHKEQLANEICTCVGVSPRTARPEPCLAVPIVAIFKGSREEIGKPICAAKDSLITVRQVLPASIRAIAEIFRIFTRAYLQYIAGEVSERERSSWAMCESEDRQLTEER